MLSDAQMTCSSSSIVGCSVYDGSAQPQPMLYTLTSAVTPLLEDHSATCESAGFLGAKLSLGQAAVPAQRPPCTKKSAKERSGVIRSVTVSSSKSWMDWMD